METAPPRRILGSMKGKKDRPRGAITAPLARPEAASRPAGIIDVAREAGVDPSTVSRVLRGIGGQRVSVETRQRIEAAAIRLDYRPNPTARALRLARSDTIGMVVAQLENPVFSTAIRGAQRGAEALGYSLLIAHHEPGTPAQDLFRRLGEARRVDGLLVAAADDDATLREALSEVSVPYVLLNREMPGVPCCVALDNVAAARLATEHLLSLGHRRIAHLGGRLAGYNGRRRLEGYRAALRTAGIPFDPALVAEAGYTAEGGATGMRRLLALPDYARPTAVFAATLVSGAGALRTLHEHGIAMPEAISLVALHDSVVAELLFPPLTTVAMPTEAMGQAGAEALIGMISGAPPPPSRVLPPQGLVLRASTAPPGAPHGA